MLIVDAVAMLVSRVYSFVQRHFEEAENRDMKRMCRSDGVDGFMGPFYIKGDQRWN